MSLVLREAQLPRSPRDSHLPASVAQTRAAGAESPTPRRGGRKTGSSRAPHQPADRGPKGLSTEIGRLGPRRRRRPPSIALEAPAGMPYLGFNRGFAAAGGVAAPDGAGG